MGSKTDCYSTRIDFSFLYRASVPLRRNLLIIICATMQIMILSNQYIDGYIKQLSIYSDILLNYPTFPLH